MTAERRASSRAAYRSAWAAWTKWAAIHDVAALPAEPAAVAAYLTHRAEVFRMPTVRMAAAAIAAAHRASNHDNPVAHERLILSLRVEWCYTVLYGTTSIQTFSSRVITGRQRLDPAQVDTRRPRSGKAH